MSFARIAERLGQARAYSTLSRDLSGRLALGMLGLVKRYDFSRRNVLARIGNSAMKTLSVRPKRFNGLCACVDPRDASHIDIFEEVVIENVYDLALVPFVPGMIIDCGGHIGLFTVRAMGCFPKSGMTVFEPSHRNFEMLQRTIAANGLAVDAREQAVSDKNGTATFYQRSSCGGSLSDAAGGVSGAQTVEVIDLVSHLAAARPANLLLKMDIEGEEERLIPRLIPVLPAQCAIFFETHRGLDGWQGVEHALLDAGFQVRLVRQRDPYRDGFAVRGATAMAGDRA